MTNPLSRLTPNRFAPSLIALLLGCSAMAMPAHAGWLFGGDDTPKPSTQAASVTDNPKPATDIEGNVRQAHMLRQAGQYKEAIHHLSQLMLVASDDGRVVGEYGKTLAQMGRAQDAAQFLTRAEQLTPSDWTIASALGVAYDELGDQDKARAAYQRALTLKPDEPSVLNNYALSRLLAHDPQTARELADRARAAGGDSDPKIKRNLVMIDDMAPVEPGKKAKDNKSSIATAAPAPVPAPTPAHVATPANTELAKTQHAAPHGVPEPVLPAQVAASAPASNKTAYAVSGANGAPPFVFVPVAQGAPSQTSPSAGTITVAAHNNVAAHNVAAQAANVLPRGVVMQKVPVDPLAGPVAHHKAAHKPQALAAAKPAAGASHAPAKPVTQVAQAATVKKAAPAKESVPAKKTATVKTPAKTARSVKDTVPALRLSANAY